jgi:hypothetical protein
MIRAYTVLVIKDRLTIASLISQLDGSENSNITAADSVPLPS